MKADLRLYLLGIPIFVVIIAGLLTLVYADSFTITSIALLPILLVGIPLVAKDSFPQDMTLSSVTNSIMLPYIALSSIFGLATYLFFDIAPLDRSSEWLGLVESQSHPNVFLLKPFLNPLSVIAFVWFFLVPAGSYSLSRFVRHNRKTSAAAALIGVGTILAIILPLSKIDFAASTETLEKLTDGLLWWHLSILFVTGLVALGVFLLLITAPDEMLTAIDSQAVITLLFPGLVGVMNLVTIVQGFNGLMQHYSGLKSIAFVGIISATIGIFLSIGFSVAVVRKSLQRHNLSHLLLALSMAVSLGCVVMFACAEIAGFWLKHYNAEAANAFTPNTTRSFALEEYIAGKELYWYVRRGDATTRDALTDGVAPLLWMVHFLGGKEAVPMPTSRPPYPPEFRQHMVELVRAGRTPEELGREIEPTGRCGRGSQLRGSDEPGAQGTAATSPGEPPATFGPGDSGKSHGQVRSGERIDPPEVFRFVRENQAMYPIATMCRLLGVSTSGSYAWRRCRTCSRALRDAALTAG